MPRWLLAWAIAHDLDTFVVPDARLARTAGLDLEASGLRPVATPRHATVLLLVGPIPDDLAIAASVAYAQMPRPRAILAVGLTSIADLPEPDVVSPLGQDALLAGVAELRRQLEVGAFAAEAATFEPAAARTKTEYVCPMHPEIVRDEPGPCPICGMDLVPHETADATTKHAHGHGPMEHLPQLPPDHAPEPDDHGAHGSLTTSLDMHTGYAAERAGHETAVASKHGDMGHGAEAGATMGHGDMNHGGMDHGMMDHAMPAGGGFMSMVAMTKDLRRSADGLPMEWIETPFGPLIPGLPGGLDVNFTLDGDGVATAAATVATARGLPAMWPGPTETFPERLARVDPLAAVAYRLLGRRALEAVAVLEIDQTVAYSRIRDAEWERVGSHLGWLAEFGFLIGDRWIAERAADLQVAVARGASNSRAELVKEIRGFVAAVSRVPLLDRRLDRIGVTDAEAAASVSGPVARAAGIATDARLNDNWYQALGFTPVVRGGGDALARLQVRLAEIVASLDLLVAALDGVGADAHDAPLPSNLSGTAVATVETPRGEARVRIADALVAVASLDLSPWEVAR